LAKLFASVLIDSYNHERFIEEANRERVGDECHVDGDWFERVAEIVR
jgi:hypothetical protein